VRNATRHPTWSRRPRTYGGLGRAEWVPQIMEVLGIDRSQLSIIWDVDCLCSPRTASGEDTYVLFEINVLLCHPRRGASRYRSSRLRSLLVSCHIAAG